MRLIEESNPDYESCANCIHSDDSEEICVLRRCIHAVSRLKECYVPKSPTIEPERKTGKYHDPFGNPIYVYVRVDDKTVAIKADDLQKALDYVTEHGEEVTIKGRREAVDTAISALQEQDLQPTCNQLATDCISRQAAIDAISCDITVTGKQNAELVAATIGTFADRIKALPPAQPEITKGDLIKAIQAGIDTMQKDNVYECGMRNGMRWCKALLGEKLDFEDPLQYCKQDDFCSYVERRTEE